MLFEANACAIVAGANDGAGACETVWVLEMAERDLSRSSKTAWNNHGG